MSFSDRIKKVDPHIDIADLYKFLNYSQDDFYSDKDLPVNLSKLKQANIQVVGTTLYFDESFLETDYYYGVMSFYNWYKELFAKSDELYEILSAKDIDGEGSKIGTIYTIEGFDCFRTIDDFNEFYELGVRIFGPTWQGDNAYSCGRHSDNDRGLTEKGRDLFALMRGQELIVDIAHASEETVRDIAEVYDGMIVCTHSNVRSIYDTKHNLTDSEISIIAERGGVVSLFPLAEDTGVKGTVEELYQHIFYVANKWGEDYVAFSSDIYPLDEYPFLDGYKDVLVLNAIEDMVVSRFGKALAEKFFYGNWMRVFKQGL